MIFIELFFTTATDQLDFRKGNFSGRMNQTETKSSKGVEKNECC